MPTIPAVSADVQMLIRKPVAEVFDAFVDPAVTTKFWFTKSTGKVVPGAKLVWSWEMYGASAPVAVQTVETNKRIVVEWGTPPTTIEWRFTPRADGTTLVSISNRGFAGTDEEVVAKALDSKGGFSFLLAGLKAWLEHGVELRLVADHYPDAHKTTA